MVIPAVANFEALPGRGVRGTVEGQQIYVGADKLFVSAQVDTDQAAEAAARIAAQGRSVVFVVIGKQLAAIMAVADTLRPDAQATIDALHARDLRVAMITGDHQRPAQTLADQLGVDHVTADVLPEGKVQALNELAADGQKVAFVGDGINDAPALAHADVGIAIGTGTDVAIESADVVLMADDLRSVLDALSISRATMRNIRQNLFWAFAYNVLLIPIAAGVFYPLNGWLLSPALAALAMALSSVFVVVNALRLRRVAL